jgi:site-specific recombinase XerD
VRDIRAARVTTSSGEVTWTVVGVDGLPITEVDQFLHWLRSRNCSVNTIEAYARHLADLYTWLRGRGLAWNEVTFTDLADFMLTLRKALPPLPKRGGGERRIGSVKAAAAAVREFYEYQRIEHRQGPTDLSLTTTTGQSTRTTKHFLAHVEQRRPVEVNRLSVGLGKGKPPIQVIDFEADFALLQGAARSARDRLVLSAFYDLGLRIGQATGLQHGDLDVMRRKVQVERRTSNPNGALSKRRTTYEVTAPARFFDLYREYLLDELTPLGIDSDYVFVNIQRGLLGTPVTYSNMYQQCLAISQRAGLGDVNPHMLRHTHATALAKAGWTAAEIAARLGHEHASSADVYIHLATNDLDDRLAQTQHLIWPPLPDKGEDAA